jgi:RNA polymerase-interacting CarD/CdnL/TRCF family regulator
MTSHEAGKRRPGESVTWKDSSSLEDWVRKAFRSGQIEEAAALVRCLPKERREHYRKLLKEIRGTRK